MARINVIGWYGHRNIGDESYKLSFPRVFPEHDFIFSEKPLIGVEGYILGGGDIISEDYLNALTEYKNKHIMSVTLSSTNKSLTDFSTIAVRDIRSVNNAAASGVHAMYVPDFAFALSPNPDRGKELIRGIFKNAGHDQYSKVISVVVNAHLMPDHAGYARDLFAFQHFTSELGKCMDETSASFLMLPFGRGMPWDDRTANSWAVSRCKWWKKNVCVYEDLSVQDTLDIIAASDAMISTRLHSTIFACLSCTPFVDVTHGHKNLGFLEATSLTKHSMPYMGIESKSLMDKLKTLMGNAEVKSELAKVKIKQRTVLSGFAKDVDLIKG
jgi:polysaccharide pyruvyl transferase WcaK-like protein